VPGFIRRFGSFPSTEQIMAIEGVTIVDAPQPGSIQGVQSGVACVVGEFPDYTYATDVSPTNGAVTTKAQPVEVFSAQDMLNKLGGWDPTIGAFGSDLGSGFLSVRNKKFARLICVPINLASAFGARFWRELPTNKAASDPTPIVQVAAATVPAGKEFKATTNRVLCGKRLVFTDSPAYASGIDADTAVAASAATQNITMVGGNFVNRGVKKGDVLVLGVIGGASYLGTNAGTYRVVSVTSATVLVVEKQDGSNFAWVDEASAAQPWRLHVGETADTGPKNSFTEQAGYLIPCRPLDATIAVSTTCTPTVAAAAGTGSTWDPLSGLTMKTHSAGSLVYTGAVQGPNAASASGLDALYATAIDSLLTDDAPAREVNILWSARKSAAIRTKLKAHALAASAIGIGRTVILSPSLTTLTLAATAADTDPGVGGSRDERVFYSWPGVRHLVPEAVNASLVTSDGKTTTDGVLDDTADGWLASVLSNLAPERNPGQVADPVPTVLAPVAGFQRGAPVMGMNEYIQMRSVGICGLRRDQAYGFFFQSGVTTSQTSGQKNINRRRTADFIQDSISRRLLAFSKLPLSNQLKDGARGEVEAFLEELLSPNNAAAQRIAAYEVDVKSGNTPDLEAKGIFVIIVRVRMMATADFIVLQAEVGENVTITSAA
jgi:hypothetical protein